MRAVRAFHLGLRDLYTFAPYEPLQLELEKSGIFLSGSFNAVRFQVPTSKLDVETKFALHMRVFRKHDVHGHHACGHSPF